MNKPTEFIEPFKLSLSGNTILSYVEIVHFALWDGKEETFPEIQFNDYAIIISPVSTKRERVANNVIQYQIKINVYAIIRDSGTQSPDILEMIEHIQIAVDKFLKNNRENLFLTGSETAENVDFSMISPEGFEGLFKVQPVPVNVQLLPYIPIG